MLSYNIKSYECGFEVQVYIFFDLNDGNHQQHIINVDAMVTYNLLYNLLCSLLSVPAGKKIIATGNAMIIKNMN